MQPKFSTSVEPDLMSDDFGGPMPECVYSEGISIAHDGPSRDCTYAAHLQLNAERNFKETVMFSSRMVPVIYCTSLIVDTSHATSMRYVEEIGFKPRWAARYFAETVYNYPLGAEKHYVSTLVYDPDSVQCKYVTGLRICAPVNCIDLGRIGGGCCDLRSSDGPPPPPLKSKRAKDESSNLDNGQVQCQTAPKCHNGLNGDQRMKGCDENCNTFNSTKEILIG